MINREKYCRGICSAEYIKTGVPQAENDRKEDIQEEVARLYEEDKKNVKTLMLNAIRKCGRRIRTT